MFLIQPKTPKKTSVYPGKHESIITPLSKGFKGSFERIYGGCIKFIYLFVVLRSFQHCTGHDGLLEDGRAEETSRGNQYIQLVKVL